MTLWRYIIVPQCWKSPEACVKEDVKALTASSVAYFRPWVCAAWALAGDWMSGAEAHIAGVDGCRTGWIAVDFPIAEPARAEVRLLASAADLLAALPAYTILAVDMPIGLPDRVGSSGRTPDRVARDFLGSCRSRVFPVPSRRAVEAYEEGYARVCTIARETSEPKRAPSIQAFRIFRKILEIDALLRGTSACGSACSRSIPRSLSRS